MPALAGNATVPGAHADMSATALWLLRRFRRFVRADTALVTHMYVLRFLRPLLWLPVHSAHHPMCMYRQAPAPSTSPGLHKKLHRAPCHQPPSHSQQHAVPSHRSGHQQTSHAACPAQQRQSRPSKPERSQAAGRVPDRRTTSCGCRDHLVRVAETTLVRVAGTTFSGLPGPPARGCQVGTAHHAVGRMSDRKTTFSSGSSSGLGGTLSRLTSATRRAPGSGRRGAAPWEKKLCQTQQGSQRLWHVLASARGMVTVSLQTKETAGYRHNLAAWNVQDPSKAWPNWLHVSARPYVACLHLEGTLQTSMQALGRTERHAHVLGLASVISACYLGVPCAHGALHASYSPYSTH
jgi:hypothetical protein